MELTAAWCLCLSMAAVAAASYGGPPPADADMPSGGREPSPDLPLPGKEIERVPVAAMPSAAEELPHIIRFVYADAIPLTGAYEVGRAAETPAEPSGAAEASASDSEGSSTPAPGGSPAPGTASSGGIRDRIKNLANRVTSWLPNLSAYIPHLPNYLPGLDLELEAHQHPLKVPHIPGPSELLRDFNALLDAAMEKLHRKHEEIAELVKCTTPIPKECQNLFQDFVKPPGPISGPGPAGAGSAPAVAPDGKPLISFYAGYTKPEGPSHGLGFYLDNHGRPHLGHPDPVPPPPVETKGGKDANPPAAKPDEQSPATPPAAGSDGPAPAPASATPAADTDAAAPAPAAGADGSASDKPDAPIPAEVSAPASNSSADSADKESPAAAASSSPSASS